MEIWMTERAEGGSLFVQQCGWQACAPSHQYGPAVRDHYLIHFVASGSGVFWMREQRYVLAAGQGFIIFPGQVTTYRADEHTPWTYGWVGYAGYDADLVTRQVGLTREQPLFSCDQTEALFGVLRGMSATPASMRLAELSMLGSLYQALALIGQRQQESSDIHREYYRKALWYMEGNYERAITIEEVAGFVGLSRSQLFRVFQKIGGTSPKACLSAMRMRRVRILLTASALTQEEIAASVGLSSAVRLGILFKQAYGMTLGEYRRKKGASPQKRASHERTDYPN